MKFLGYTILIIGIIVGALLFLKKHQSSSTAPATGTPTTTQATQQSGQQPPAAGQQQSTPQQGQQTPQQPARQSKLSQFQEVANSVGVQIVQYQESGGSATITVQWQSSSAGPGGDFLDEALKRGLIRDFEDKDSNYGYDSQGRQTWQAKYELMW